MERKETLESNKFLRISQNIEIDHYNINIIAFDVRIVQNSNQNYIYFNENL